MRLRDVERNQDGLGLYAQEVGSLYRHLVRVVRGVCGDRDLAHDAAQEALVRLWEQRQQARDISNEQAWATRTALNWARSRLRRRRAEARALRRLAAREQMTEHEYPDGSLSEDVHRVLLSLPYRQREVMVLHYLLDMDITTIAATLERSEGAVKNALFRGRKTLSRAVEPDNHLRQASSEEVEANDERS